jgi:Membrane protein involved in the export of O-antigen and teichoic acid
VTLKKKIINSGKWSSISGVVIILLQLVQTSVVARFVDPSAFGLIGITLMIIGFANNVTDLGISGAIIQRRHTTKKQLSTLYWLNVFSGIFVFFVVWLIKGQIVQFFRNDSLIGVLSLSSLLFLISPFGQQFQTLMQKELKFKEISYITMCSTLAGTISSIVLSLANFGVYSLVWGQLTNTILSTVCFVVYGMKQWRPSLYFNHKELKGYLGFGLYQVGERVVTYFNNNLDVIIIGRFLGAELLGYYTIAYNLIIIPLTKINPIITKIAFPVFSILQDDNSQLKRGYLNVIRILSTINFPLYFGLAAVSPVFIPVFFGEKWGLSVQITQIMCGVGILRSIANPSGSLVVAKGLSKLSFMYNSFKTLLQIPVIFAGAYYGGVKGVAIAYLALKCFYFISNYRVVIRRVIGPCFIEYSTLLLKSLSNSLIMAFSVGAVLWVLQPKGIWGLFALILLGACIYGLLLYKFNPDLMQSLKNKADIRR